MAKAVAEARATGIGLPMPARVAEPAAPLPILGTERAVWLGAIPARWWVAFGAIVGVVLLAAAVWFVWLAGWAAAPAFIEPVTRSR